MTVTILLMKGAICLGIYQQGENLSPRQLNTEAIAHVALLL